MKKFLGKLYDFSSSWTGTVIIVLLVIFFVAQAFVIPSGSMKNTLLIGDHLFVKKFSYGIPTPRIPWLEVKVMPELNGNGHLITADGPKRGDIVVFRYPYDDKIHYVKRNFAIGEDEVVFSEKQTFLRPHEGDEYIRANYDQNDIVELDGKLFVKEPYKFSGVHYDENVNMFEQMIYYLNAGKLAMKPLRVSSLAPNDKYGFNAFYFKVPKDEYFMMGDNRDHSNDSRFWGSVRYEHIVGKPWFIYFSWDGDYRIRWERIGRFVDTVQNDDKFINFALKENEVDGLH
ncbi:signal peptidase I [Campylobacter sp. RM9344]|uniref:Signal peptidase I n=1 Tax=Campylobacter californiensis TaxID=1032243 RepID=A0AAW3ZU70_9BACT|nr:MULTISPECIES: signal peptidase I [unclassified Campylobacter]MBE2984833.1 signal peptidase I [Campylobacter sp. RM6883]MBE2994701.1 signal peptidase I [Campylobacter sp. RM6913]MBE3029567.1 signal peptidase I [Campylobacter sp. RM9344]MBE3608357.1 signal peptidase I [Campylobacter sp. RM9337]QCD50510.1 leader peptidase (signal peptidase I) [Campylobacter sp. RM6914]